MLTTFFGFFAALSLYDAVWAAIERWREARGV
jgi:hypothetical protein